MKLFFLLGLFCGSMMAAQELILIGAVERGDVAVAQDCIARGDDVNQTDEYGATALYAACFRAHDELVRILLEAGADPMILPNNGTVTPLYVAAARQAWGIVVRLLAAGADPLVKGDLDSGVIIPTEVGYELTA